MNSAEAERLGREAVELGFEWARRHRVLSPGCHVPYFATSGPIGWHGEIPDFNHEPTALATIPWVRSVCRDRWPGCHITHTDPEAAWPGIQVSVYNDRDDMWDSVLNLAGETLAHACIAAVKATRQ